MGWWYLPPAFRFWFMAGVFLALAVATKLNWSRLPRWLRWLSLTGEGLLGVGLVGVMLMGFVSNLCSTPRRDAASTLLMMGGTLIVVGVVYLRTVLGQLKKLRRANDVLKQRVAAAYPDADVLVADDGSVTFKSRMS